ncbi:hypothetical protein AB833_12605 [Chromatiales bacterium (ex Bugula neritina AB1)]|nr:hypothetical protein AB833_12605 [Chromatiales bacterium (ex Bugula neritina AB1)]
MNPSGNCISLIQAEEPTVLSPFELREKYRVFRAYNKYSYPFLFFLIGSGKTIAQIGMVAAAVWFAYPVADNFLNSSSTSVSVAAAPASTPLDHAITSDKIEIPAVANNIISSGSGSGKLGKLNSSQNTPLSAKRMFDLDPEQYTIQFESSPDKDLLFESAEAFASEFPIIVFPFKKTPSDRLVYGYSSGVYSSLESALSAIEMMPGKIRALNPWVRPISDIQKQITATQLTRASLGS